ncbi:MAG: hypothetical protein IT374_27830 [Polyangiaceae bacterium]|nr:hypothetical protein [Polyangiaceae bacterium]
MKPHASSALPLSDTQARAKTVAPRTPSLVSLVPARMVNEILYCERLMYLEWAQREFADNAFTVEGRLVHKRADTPGGALPPKPTPSADAASTPAAEERPYQARSVWLEISSRVVDRALIKRRPPRGASWSSSAA